MSVVRTPLGYGDFIEKNVPVLLGPHRVAFEDDEWTLLDLLRPDAEISTAAIRFDRLPGWLRNDGKRWVASHWLEIGSSLERIRSAMGALVVLGRALDESHPSTPMELRRHHAARVRSYILEQGHSPGTNLQRRGLINQFVQFVREEHPAEAAGNTFELTLPRHAVAGASPAARRQSPEKYISSAVLAQVLDACASDEAAYKAALAGTPKGLRRIDHLGRAMKAQAIKLSICVGRRATALCTLPVDVRVEEAELDGVWGVWVRFRETKIRDIEEDVWCPGVWGQIAVDAIEKARSLGEALRSAVPRYGGFLFVIPGSVQKGEKATLLKPALLNQYLRYRKQGLLDRHGITERGDAVHITTHNFRTTRATNLDRGGMSAHDIGQDLGHAADSDMAIRCYIVGDEGWRREFDRQMEAGALQGELIDLINGRQVVSGRLGARQVEIMRRRGLVLTPTRYGYCTLPSSSGPCPTANDCFIGPCGSEGACGCAYHVHAPHGLAALDEEEEICRANLAEFVDEPERYARWIEHEEYRLTLIDQERVSLVDLQARMETAG